MAESSRKPTVIIIIIVLLALLLLLLVKCRHAEKPAPVAPTAHVPAAPTTTRTESVPAPQTPAVEVPEVLTPATLQVPAQVTAGAVFSVQWTGPNNKRDYITIVPKDAAEPVYTNYRETSAGATLDLMATMEPGEFEVRYVAARSKKVLGRASVTIVPAPATLDAPASVVLGSKISVGWTGPNNPQDYVTVVAKDAPDGKYDNFAYTATGSPVLVTAPVTAGDAELRYMTGQGHKVLARREVKITFPEVSISAPAQIIAGANVPVSWSGPNNDSDYITIVSKETPDGKYGNYTYTRVGASLQILVPIMSGDAELRYMTGQGNKVLGRKAITVVAATIRLSCADRVTAGTELSVTWEGPNNGSDYITLVPKSLPDGQYRNYTYTAKGSPLTVTVAKEAGDAEIRYMAGQGNKVLGRKAVTIVSP